MNSSPNSGHPLIGITLLYLVLLPLQAFAQDIHHNLPDNLEIVDPKSLGLSGTDLDKFLGNVKILPLEGSIAGSGGPKTQILTVGFDGSEQLNLQDFESLSTAGLPEADKHVAELAFKKFQNFFQNPNSGKDFDEILKGSTEYSNSLSSGSTTPSTTTTTERENGNFNGNVKYRKGVRIGKRPMFSSTFRTIRLNDPAAEIATTVRYEPNTSPHYTQALHSRPTHVSENGYRKQPNRNQHHIQQYHHQNHLQQNYRNQHQSQPPRHKLQIRPQSSHFREQSQRTNPQQNYITSPMAQITQSQPMNSINKLRYNVAGSALSQIQNGGQSFHHHRPQKIVLKYANQKALKESQKQNYPHVPVRNHFSINEQKNSRPFPSVQPQVNAQKYSKFQHSSSPRPTTFEGPRVPSFALQQNFRYPMNQGLTGSGLSYEQKNSNRIPLTSHRHQKQIPFPPSGGFPQRQVQASLGDQRQNHLNGQHVSQNQEVDQQRHEFDLINQHRSKHQNLPQGKIRPSQVDPIQNEVVRPQAQFRQIMRHPKNMPSNGFQHQLPNGQGDFVSQQQRQQYRWQAPSETTPRSISMTGVVQVTPSTPMIPISTVENAMNAYRTLKKLQQAQKNEPKHVGLKSNPIPLGRDEPNYRVPAANPSYQQNQGFPQPLGQNLLSSPPQTFPVQHHAQPPPTEHTSIPVHSQGRFNHNRRPLHRPEQVRPLHRPEQLPPQTPPPFQQDPIREQGHHHQPHRHFLPEPSRYISAPRPPTKGRELAHAPIPSQTLREQKRLPPRRPLTVNQNGNRPTNFLKPKPRPQRVQQPHFPRFRKLPQHQRQNLNQVNNPAFHRPGPSQTSGNQANFIRGQNFHREANNYVNSLLLNVHSINSAP